MNFCEEQSKLKSVIKSTDRLIDNYMGAAIAAVGVDSLFNDESNTFCKMLKPAIELKNEMNELLIDYDKRFTQMEKNQQEILNMLKDYKPTLENIDRQTRIK